MGSIVHAKPTSHGTGPRSFGARDDSSLTSATSEHVASSPFQSASSALAVGFEVQFPSVNNVMLLLIVSCRYSTYSLRLV